MTNRPRDSAENNWGFGTDDPASHLAGKLYGSQVAHLRQVIGEYDIGAERLSKTFEAARAEADRSAAILLFALSEDLMLSGLKQHLHGDVKGGWDALSSANGLLATANDRITLLALLGWIHPAVYSDLRNLKAIRNRFAHHPDVIGFGDQKVTGHVSALCPIETAVSAAGGDDEALKSPRLLFLARAANTVVRLVFNLAVAPAARKSNVAPGHIDNVPWEQLPANLQELHHILADHLMALAAAKP